jgi:hypothetical protein
MLEDFDQAAGVSLFQSVACFRVLIWEQAIGCLVYSMLEHFDKRAVDAPPPKQRMPLGQAI